MTCFLYFFCRCLLSMSYLSCLVLSFEFGLMAHYRCFCIFQLSSCVSYQMLSCVSHHPICLVFNCNLSLCLDCSIFVFVPYCGYCLFISTEISKMYLFHRSCVLSSLFCIVVTFCHVNVGCHYLYSFQVGEL